MFWFRLCLLQLLQTRSLLSLNHFSKQDINDLRRTKTDIHCGSSFGLSTCVGLPAAINSLRFDLQPTQIQKIKEPHFDSFTFSQACSFVFHEKSRPRWVSQHVRQRCSIKCADKKIQGTLKVRFSFLFGFSKAVVVWHLIFN